MQKSVLNIHKNCYEHPRERALDTLIDGDLNTLQKVISTPRRRCFEHPVDGALNMINLVLKLIYHIINLVLGLI
jgi:hypothetical protein